MRGRPIDDALERLAAAEDRFLACEFLAPVVEGRTVQVRIAGMVARLRVSTGGFRGYGVFRPESHAAARLVRPATLSERRAYLDLFPLVRLVLCRQEGPLWLAVAAHRGDRRFRIDGLVPVRLADDVQQFDVVRTRFDGGAFWHDGPEPSRDPAAAAWLRAQLRQAVPANRLDRPGLTPEERLAYAVLVPPADGGLAAAATEIDEGDDASTGDPESRLGSALRHGGAELLDYLERGDSFRVSYRVRGRTYTSAVSKDDLTVQAAGICLSGGDRNFDLASLVGVLREAEGGALVRNFVP